MTQTVQYTAYSGFANATFTVSNQAQLDAAIASAASTGGTIYLDGSGGPYDLTMNAMGSADHPVLVQSLDASNPATVSSVSMMGSSYLTLTDVTVNGGGVADGVPDVQVQDSNHIEVVNITMDGVAEGRYEVDPTAVKGDDAVMLRDSSNVVFSGNTITNYYHGVSMLGLYNSNIDSNDISALQGDGIRGGGLQGLSISNNYIHDFFGTTTVTNHADAIQVWTAFPPDVPNHDLVISGNYIDSGEGSAFQGILVQNDVFDDPTAPLAGTYLQNVTITDNVVYSGTYGGIAVMYIEGLTINNNTVLWDQNANVVPSTGADPISNPPFILVRYSPGATVTGNIAQNFLDENGTYPTGDNYVVNYNDPSSPNYAFHHFTGLSESAGLTLQDLQVAPDSPLAGHYGADLSIFQPSASGVEAIIGKEVSVGNRMGLTLSAEYSSANGALLDPATTHYVWTFDDGTVMEGVSVVHGMSTPGDHTVQLQITAADGSQQTVTRDFHVGSHQVFATDFSNGGADDYMYHSDIVVNDNGGAAWTTGQSGSGFHLDGTSQFQVSGTNDQLHNLDTMHFSLDVNPNALDQTGQILTMPTAYDLQMLKGGELLLHLTTNEGSYTIDTNAGVLTAGDWSHVSIDFDGVAGNLSLSVNGTEVGSTTATGTIGAEGRPLIFGNPWGNSANVVIDNVQVTTPTSAAFVEGAHDTGTGTGTTTTHTATTHTTTTHTTTAHTSTAHTTTTHTTTTDTSTGNSTTTGTGTTHTATTTGTTTDTSAGNSTTTSDTGTSQTGTTATPTTHTTTSHGGGDNILVQFLKAIAELFGIHWKDASTDMVTTTQTTTAAMSLHDPSHDHTSLDTLFPDAGLIHDTATTHTQTTTDHTDITMAA